jgi:hypothetical protein
VDIQQMNAAINNVERELGNALLSTDVWKITDGESIAGYNSQPMACALFNQITDYVNEALEQGEHPKLEKYYILSLEGDKMVLIMPLGEYIWEMFIDTKRTRLGVLLNVTIPQMLETFEKIIST